MDKDRFGNVIDSSVGFARGRHLTDSAAEIRRLRHAQSVAAGVVSVKGIEAIGIFTGNPRYFPLKPEDLDSYCEEWIGPGLFASELAEVAIAHFGGRYGGRDQPHECRDCCGDTGLVGRATCGVCRARRRPKPCVGCTGL
ncbi:hypothetical protein [Sulfitobacter aestuariivivens]|uniref:hypothetical protein n=1 Tax=Sulfitobacter aestuariivivens TaxID=2766981 RepID=UPI003605E9BD